MKIFYRAQDAVFVATIIILVPVLILWAIETLSVSNFETCDRWCAEQGSELAAITGPDPVTCVCYFDVPEED